MKVRPPQTDGDGKKQGPTLLNQNLLYSLKFGIFKKVAKVRPNPTFDFLIKYMTNRTIIKKEKTETLLREMREINKNLKKFLLIIPEERLGEYKNASAIKKAFAKAVKLYPPQ